MNQALTKSNPRTPRTDPILLQPYMQVWKAQPREANFK